MKISNIQHCIEKNDENEFATYINEQHNVTLQFNNTNDELTIEGEYDCIKNAMIEMFDNDIEQIEMYMQI